MFIGSSLALSAVSRRGSGAFSLTAPYTSAVAIDFREGSMSIKDTVTPANNFNGLWKNKVALTRATTAWYLDDSGVLQSAASGVARVSPVRGMLIEQASTNTVLDNSAFTGAAVGVIGSGGALPATWPGFGAVTGITREVVAIGTLANGMPYIDIKLSGTNSSGSTGFPDLYFRPHTGNTAASGETWSGSFYAQIVSGSRSGFVVATTKCGIGGRTGAGAFVEAGSGAAITDGSMATFQRLTHTYTMANASTASATLFLELSIPAGGTVNITYRIALPQLEKTTVQTSPILTTGSTVTRNADVIASLSSSAFNLSQTVGTLFASGKTNLTDTTAAQMFSTLSDGTTANMAQVKRQSSTGNFNGTVTVASVATGAPSDTALSNDSNFKGALAWAANDVASVLNGGTVQTDATFSTPTSMNRLEAGQIAAGQQANCWIKQILHVPQRLSNSAIQALTT